MFLMGHAMPEFEQFNVLLPEDLAGFLRREATKRDFTISGLLRHYVSEAHRAAPREGAPTFPDALAPAVPAVKPDGRSIAEAKAHLGELEAERERIKQRQRRWSDTAADGARLDRLNAEVELFRKNIASAQRMLPRNGGQNV
jgi:hypothetical protein